MVERIESALARKLDMFTVPALPADFSARVLAGALALPAGEAAPAAPPLPRQRRALPRRLWRAGASALGTIAVGMISISAAAMGYFGEPVREALTRAPVIGTVVERVIPRRVRKAAMPQLAARPTPRTSAPVASAAPAGQLEPPAGPGWRARAAAMTPEQREAWLAAHPLAAQRIARRQAWRENHPELAARRDQLHAQRRAVAAKRRELRRAARSAMQRQQLAPEAAAASAVAAPGMEPRPWRLERRERLRQWREHRRQLRDLPDRSPPAASRPDQP